MNLDEFIDYAIKKKRRFVKGNSNFKDGNIGIFYVDNRKFIVDAEFINLVKTFTWHFDKKGYVSTGIVLPNGKHRTLKLHQLIMGMPPDGMEIDHKYRMKWDNRKENMRFVTSSQNSLNRNARKGSTTGIPGVTLVDEIFNVSITLEKKRIYIGSCSTIDEARDMRKKAESQYWNGQELTFKRRKTNTGIKGVSLYPTGKYRVDYYELKNGKSYPKYLGMRDTLDEAIKLWKKYDMEKKG